MTDPAAMRGESRAARSEGRTIGFVPTMGFLHEGHLSLVRRSRAERDLTVASIFVNPSQFAPGEDFERYPRDPERDLGLLEGEGTDLLFAPEAAALYAPGHSTWVEVGGLSQVLCGAHRPGHFRGVATIIAKLLNIVRPDTLYLGQKDAQQAVLLTRMAAELDFETQVAVCPTVREPDGLALSSRNVYLTAEQRKSAPALYAALSEARDLAAAGERDAGTLRAVVCRRLEAAGFRPQYVETVSASDLRPLEILGGEVLLAVAAHLGSTRLIDNVVFTVPDRAPAREEPRRSGGVI